MKQGIGTNNEDVSSMNKAVIIRYLQRNGICTRAQISKAIGLTQASISKTVSVLIEEGIVEENGYIAGEKGRRSVGISIGGGCKRVLGVRLSRRSFSVGVFDIAGRMYDHISEEFSFDATLKSVLQRIKALLHGLLEKYDDLAAIGVAVPGPFNVKSGEILLTTSMATSDWTHIRLKEELGKEFSIPVVIRHDANAGAMANWWFGSYVKDPACTLVHFLVGEGVGAGVISKEQVFEGNLGFSGEIGHVSVDVDGPRCKCGNFGCLELYCSTFAFVGSVRQALQKNTDSTLCRIPHLTPVTVFEAAAAGDRLAKELTERLGRYIGYGVVTLINTYDPSIIVISNELAKGGQPLLECIRQTVRERVLEGVFENVSIVLEEEKLLQDPVLFGAGAVAIDYCLGEPLMLAAVKNDKNTEKGVDAP